MARIVVARPAVEQLDRLIESHSLPADTRERIRRSIRPLERFPELGRIIQVDGLAVRFVVGPWPWLLVVYRVDRGGDLVEVVAIEDARAADSATSRRPT